MKMNTRIATRHPEVGAMERARYQVVLLDEFQDTIHAHLFLQAEVGIRGLYVTGVQTCALPICARPTPAATGRLQPPGRPGGPLSTPLAAGAAARRSEERRVGKECRSRWSR